MTASSELLADDDAWVPARTADPPWYEQALVVAGLLIVLGTFKQILPGVSENRTGGSAMFQLVSGSIYLAGIFILLYRGFPLSRLRILIVGWPLVAFTLLALASTLWAQEPEATLRRAVAVTLSSLFAYYIVVRFEPRAFFNLLLYAFIAFVAVGAITGVTGEGVTRGGNYDGAWRGLTGNKNEFGRSLALAVALLPAMAVLRLVDRPKLALATAAVALALLLLADSATSFVTAFGSVAVGSLVYALMGGTLPGGIRFTGELRAMAAIAMAATAITVIPLAWAPALEAIGRDATLTGRTDLWVWAVGINDDRMLLGSGYRSFWIDENTRYFFIDFSWNMDNEGNRSDTFAGPSHAHSGYVDVLLELGIVGVVAFALTIGSSFVNLARTARNGDGQVGFIFAVILSFLLIYAIPAKSILQQSEDLWFLFTLLYLYSVKGQIKSIRGEKKNNAGHTPGVQRLLRGA